MGTVLLAFRGLRSTVFIEDPSVIARSASGTVHETPTAATYVDPHLIVLLFLLGFCLLYALLIAVDAVRDGRSIRHLPEK